VLHGTAGFAGIQVCTRFGEKAAVEAGAVTLGRRRRDFCVLISETKLPAADGFCRRLATPVTRVLVETKSLRMKIFRRSENEKARLPKDALFESLDAEFSYLFHRLERLPQARL
jgi:hypothetical protein